MSIPIQERLTQPKTQDPRVLPPAGPIPPSDWIEPAGGDPVLSTAPAEAFQLPAEMVEFDGFLLLGLENEWAAASALAGPTPELERVPEPEPAAPEAPEPRIPPVAVSCNPPAPPATALALTAEQTGWILKAPAAASFAPGVSIPAPVEAETQSPVWSATTLRPRIALAPKPAPPTPKPAAQPVETEAEKAKAVPAKPKAEPEKGKPEAPKAAEAKPARPAETKTPERRTSTVRITNKPAETRVTEPRRDPRPTPAIAARDGSAVPAASPVPAPAVIKETAPAARPKVVPIKEPVEQGPALTLPLLEPSPVAKFWSNANIGVKAAVILLALGLAGGGGYLAFSRQTPVHVPAGVAPAEDGMMAISLGSGGWAANWGADLPSNKDKQISLYRPSMLISDYRFEFHGQIEKKAMGWIIRASDPKNYYVLKLEQIKGGTSPVVALVKYAVIKGKETTHTQVMLPMKVSPSTLYKVRTDVLGSKFTTWVQDQLVDYWTDERLTTGGAGFYSEKGESARVRTSHVAALK